MACVKSKLFVIGGQSPRNCEVFDKTNGMFVTFRIPYFTSWSVECCGIKAVSIGSKIFFIKQDTQRLLCYDVVEDEWTTESCNAVEAVLNVSFVKLPCY